MMTRQTWFGGILLCGRAIEIEELRQWGAKNTKAGHMIHVVLNSSNRVIEIHRFLLRKAKFSSKNTTVQTNYMCCKSITDYIELIIETGDFSTVITAQTHYHNMTSRSFVTNHFTAEHYQYQKWPNTCHEIWFLIDFSNICSACILEIIS